MDLKNPDRERPEKFFEGNAPWELLSAAIVRVACDDYKHYTGKGRQQIERFFRSSYFRNISNIDPDWLIKNLRETFRPDFGNIRG
jgi:hypothetical protein